MAEAPKTVTITATLTDAEAWEFAQFLKRVTRSEYKALCEPYNETGPDLMQSAGDKIQKALAEAGYTPR